MTASSSQLLKMLEPALRPVAAPAAAEGVLRPSFENTSFEMLLQEARALETGPIDQAGALGDPHHAAEAQGVGPASTAGPLAALATIDRIENAALRRLLAQAADTSADFSAV